MCLDPEDEAVVNHVVPETDLKRNIIRDGKKLWPGKTVYYFVDDNLSKFFFSFFSLFFKNYSYLGFFQQQCRSNVQSKFNVSSSFFSERLRPKINDALSKISSKTCLKFKEVGSSYGGDHIKMHKGNG